MDMLSGGVEPISEFTSKALIKRLMHVLFQSTRRFLVFKTMQFYGECGVVLRDGLFLHSYGQPSTQRVLVNYLLMLALTAGTTRVVLTV